MTFTIDEVFGCVKPQGKPGERCGKQCIWFSVNTNTFIICKFLKLKPGYGMYKM